MAKKKTVCHCELNVIAFAIGLGGAWAICMLINGIGAMYGWGVKTMEAMASVYIGFDATILGSIIGALWGFLDGVLLGALIALFHNCTLKNVIKK